jgi:RNA polymerase sigma-70 factor, ECF subfamily
MLQDLADRARGGDHAAFAELVQMVVGRMSAVARLILRDEHAAQDAVQDALVDAWRDIRGLRDPERVEAWLYRILVRTCRDRARANRRRALLEVPGEVADLPRRADAIAQPPGWDLETRDRLERALARLPADQRAILVITYYLDLPLADGAQALSIPIGTMKSRLNRARLALRAALDADDRAGMLLMGSAS